MKHYDYIVDAHWEGKEGQEFAQEPSRTFKAFKSLKAALDDAENGDTFFIVSGAYTR